MSETDSSGGVSGTADTQMPATAIPDSSGGAVGGPEIPTEAVHPVPVIEGPPEGGFPEEPQAIVTAGVAAGVVAAAGLAIVGSPAIAAGAAAAGAAAFIIHSMTEDQRMLAAEGDPDGTDGPTDLDGDGLADT